MHILGKVKKEEESIVHDFENGLRTKQISYCRACAIHIENRLYIQIRLLFHKITHVCMRRMLRK